MKRTLIAVAGIVVIALAILVGGKMSADAMAVVVGVVCGIGASIPTSLFMLLLMRRREEEPEEQPRSMPQMPSIMIVNPGGGTISPYQQPPNQFLPPFNGGAPRQFHVVGSEGFDNGPGQRAL